MKLTKRGAKEFPGKDGKVLYLDLDYNYMGVDIYQKSQFIYIHFTICKFYLNLKKDNIKKEKKVKTKSCFPFGWITSLLEGVNREFRTPNRKSFHITQVKESKYFQIFSKNYL